MKRLFFCKILIIMALLAGCKKLDVEPKDGTPVFSASVAVDGASKKWEAGVGGYYMFTEFEKDSLDVYIFTGRLAQENCTAGCGEILTVRIRDFQQLLSGLPDVNAALSPGRQFSFFNPSPIDSILQTVVVDTVVSANFDASQSLFPPNLNPGFAWEFGDNTGMTVNSPQLSHVYDTIFPGMTVKLTIGSPNTCSGSLTRPLDFGGGTGGSDCSVALSIQLDSTNLDTILLIASPIGGTPPYAFAWNTGATTSAIDISNPSGQVSASVTVTDEFGCQAVASTSTIYQPGTAPPVCLAYFDYEISGQPVDSTFWQIVAGDSLQFSAVTIEYTDAAGQFFSSARQSQGPDSNFEILSIEEFDTNENGEKTKKIGIRFDCRLWDSDGNFIEMKNGMAVIGVAYP